MKKMKDLPGQMLFEFAEKPKLCLICGRGFAWEQDEYGYTDAEFDGRSCCQDCRERRWLWGDYPDKPD